MHKKYKRITEYSMVGGVCSGLAYKYHLPTWIVRLFVLLLILNGVGFVIYLSIWFLAPSYEDTPMDYKDICE